VLTGLFLRPPQIEMEEAKAEVARAPKPSAPKADINTPMGPLMMVAVLLWWAVPMTGIAWGVSQAVMKAMTLKVF
jgi:hypothetical protein